jgi:transcription initiation factor TFIIB
MDSYENNTISKSNLSRIGGPEKPLLSGRNLFTMIGPGIGVAFLMHLEVTSNTHYNYRISLNSCLFLSTLAAKFQNTWNMSSSDRALFAVFKEICNTADRINLPKKLLWIEQTTTFK